MIHWTTAEVVVVFLYGLFWGILIGEPLWRIVHFLGAPSEKNPNDPQRLIGDRSE